ncbi:protein ALTERED PHOSPHATE STARVATION RESPONSE 1 isoform X1 [Amaranthus tricolor]|uniref:protein ALTERED PHOSPHATE STARVATION RESPONSE 1 isoform X1 n=1 Tax=Amaranthus tricolor TaxID=29722 RepID=UPI00258FB244|nr:protein ALTERED PHOSPHATE STARVATION RESPONSE 1 isoform X1 [Amaranthus tricolor]
MGCASSRVDNEERVQICKERKRALKHLLGYRKEFTNAILSYLKALKDTGITLRQFAESESLEFESTLPPSPPLPLPPAPPLPPPIDSPDSRKVEGNRKGKEVLEEMIEVGDESIFSPPPPSSLGDPWGLLDGTSALQKAESGYFEDVDEENWAETTSQFEEDQENVTSDKTSGALGMKSLKVGDNSSTVTGQTAEMGRAMVVWRRKRKTLSSMVKELDDYFLKASAGGKEIAVLVDMTTWNASLHHDSKSRNGKGNHSARLSSMSWSRSSPPLQDTRDPLEVGTPVEPCKPGAHCITLEKIFAEEQTLYTTVKKEERAKLEHKRKSMSLRKQEGENGDMEKIEKLQSAVETLQCEIVHLQELVRKTSTSIMTIIDEELHPQLFALLSGLINMWRTMYECHQVQSRISQQVQTLTSHNAEPTTLHHLEIAMQLESGVNFLYTSFCKLAKSQRDYVGTICFWIRLTESPIEGENENRRPSVVRNLCEKWQLALDRLPKTQVSEAIKSFLEAVQSIIKQQRKECIQRRKLEKRERRLMKEQKTVLELEKELEMPGDAAISGSSQKQRLYEKRAKIDLLVKEHEDEKAKYENAVREIKALTLSNLHASLPRLFEELMGFSSACTQAFQTVLSHAQQLGDAQESHTE